MDTTPVSDEVAAGFELPSPLTFQKIFLSCAYWPGVSTGFIPRVVRQLRKNFRKNSFLLSANDRRLVLSVEALRPAAKRQRHSFIPVIEQAALCGIGPKLVFTSSEQGYLVSEYIDGRCWNSADFRNMANIERLVEVLKAVHSWPKIFPERLISQEVDNLWLRIREEYVKPPKRLEVLQQRMAKVIDYACVHFDERVVCHNNLLNAQLVETADGLKLAGWEYAGVNDPYYELAAIVHHHGFNESQLDHLLHCYAGQSGHSERQRFYYNYAIYVYLSALYFCVERVERPLSDQEERIEAKTDVLVALLHQIGL